VILDKFTTFASSIVAKCGFLIGPVEAKEYIVPRLRGKHFSLFSRGRLYWHLG